MAVLRRIIAIFLLLAGANQALAQSCKIPPRLPAAEARPAPLGEARTGSVRGYTLALSWSPQYCRGKGAEDGLQCGADARFGFILHGLWPEGAGRDDLAWCRPAQAVPAEVVRRSFCATPSVRLQQHEWAKHGTCMTDDPARYFKAGNLLYTALKWPDMNALSRLRPTVGAFKTAFAAANRGIRHDMMRVETNEGGWLKEVKLCLDVNFRPARCPRGDRSTSEREQVKIWRAEG